MIDIKNATPKVGRLVALFFLGVFALIVISNAFVSVQYGTVGVLTRFGQIVGDPMQPGLHFKIPFVDKVLTYKTQKIVYQTLFTGAGTANFSQNTDYISEDSLGGQQYADYEDYAVDTTTKDGQQVKITYSIRFALDPAQIKQIANSLGTEQEVVEKIVKTDSRIWARNIPRNYTALDLYTGNIGNISKEIMDNLVPSFKDNGLILDEFAIRSIHFQDQYVATIEQKQIEKEKISTEEYIAQQEEFKKKALITKAQGEAEAQRLQQQTLTKELIQKLYIEKWDGKLPSTMTGSDSGFMINLNK